MGKRACIHNVKRFKPGDKVKVVCFPDAFGFPEGAYIDHDEIKGFRDVFIEDMWYLLKKGKVFTVKSVGQAGLYLSGSYYGWPSCMFDKVKS